MPRNMGSVSGGIVAAILSSNLISASFSRKSNEWECVVPRPWYLCVPCLRLPSWNSSREK
eukprot:1927881-Heterocapsa_arctica.AAC.1